MEKDFSIDFSCIIAQYVLYCKYLFAFYLYVYHIIYFFWHEPSLNGIK